MERLICEGTRGLQCRLIFSFILIIALSSWTKADGNSKHDQLKINDDGNYERGHFFALRGRRSVYPSDYEINEATKETNEYENMAKELLNPEKRSANHFLRGKKSAEAPTSTFYTEPYIWRSQRDALEHLLRGKKASSEHLLRGKKAADHLLRGKKSPNHLLRGKKSPNHLLRGKKLYDLHRIVRKSYDHLLRGGKRSSATNESPYYLLSEDYHLPELDSYYYV